MPSPKPVTYKKPSGKVVRIPSRNIMSKQTEKSEATLGRADDTGKGRGPLRGVARRAREGMAEMTDAQIKAKYPSQNVDSKSARARARLQNSVTRSVVTPPKAVPIKVRKVGGITGAGGASVNLGAGGGLIRDFNK